MSVDKVHETISSKHSRCLEKLIRFNTQKRNLATKDFDEDLYKSLNIAFYRKTMENVRKRVKIDFIKKNNYEKIIRQHSKLTFEGIHESDTNHGSYTFKRNEILMVKPIDLGFAILELSKLLM